LHARRPRVRSCAVAADPNPDRLQFETQVHQGIEYISAGAFPKLTLIADEDQRDSIRLWLGQP